jgi:cellulose synthase operon protein YhjU
MGLWAYYFLAKLYLYFETYIDLDFILNLLFAVFLIIPIPQQFKFRKVIVTTRGMLGMVLGVILLWHDSWLPPVSQTAEFIQSQHLPMADIYGFVLTSLNWEELAVLGFLFIFCILVHDRISLAPLTIVLLMLVPLWSLGKDLCETNLYLDLFYQSESRRVVHFERPKQTDPSFDIILLHICSLSWQDLKDAGLQENSFLKQFDYLLTNFNSVSSYSNPSAIRLLKSNCGQPRHGDLYTSVDDECYLFDALRALGYQTYFTFNHDGKYDNFAEQVKMLGHLDSPFQWADLPIQQRSFDGSPVYDNYAALEKWWKVRQMLGGDRAALYHNNISLHDGNHRLGKKEWWKGGREENYRQAVNKLFNDLTKFFDLLSASGRKVVIIFVPEHGMALSGSKLQAASLRDIPLPQHTLVPVGIKFIGQNHRVGVEKNISEPTSYLALAHILASFLKHNPFDIASSQEMIATLPETAFVAENQGVHVVKQGEDYWLEGRSLNKKWIKVTPEVLR